MAKKAKTDAERELMLASPRESWLKLNDERFAEAMMRCQHAGAYCASDEYCHFDGDCFEKDGVEEAVSLGELLKEVKTLRAEVEALKEGS